MSQKSEERRKHPRSRTGFKQSTSRAKDDLFSRIDNISCSGVLCHTERPVSEMTKLSIELDLPAPANRVVRAEGIVIRCQAEYPKSNEFKVAIIYTKLSEEDQHAIRAYVEHDLGNSATHRS